MKITKVKIDSISPDPNNARKHSVKNIDSIKGSLRKFGQQKPVVVGEKNIILAGNGTYQAAKELSWTHIDIVRTTLKGWEATAYALADNRTSELAEWDKDILGDQLSMIDDLDLDDFDIGDIGFDESFGLDDDSGGEVKNTGTEVDLGEFEEFDHKCPKCAFEWDDKK